jgi:integrase
MKPKGWPTYARLSDDVGEMFRQAEGLLNRLQAERGTGLPAVVHAKGSIPSVLSGYHQSDRYKALASSTKGLYDYCANFLLEWSKAAGHPHMRYITRPIAFKFLDRFSSQPTKRKKIYVFMRVLFGYACDVGEIENNPVLAMRMKEPEAQVHIWTDHEIDTIVAKADSLDMSFVGTAVLLAAETGQRQGDVLRMKYGNDYKDGMFYFKQNKTRETVSFPATKKLRERIDAAAVPGQSIVKAKKGGRHERQKFNQDFVRVRKEAGLDHCIFMQLRHTAITHLARAGCSHVEIAAISGHTDRSVAAMMRKYLPRDSEVARNAVQKRENARKTDVLSR